MISWAGVRRWGRSGTRVSSFPSTRPGVRPRAGAEGTWVATGKQVCSAATLAAQKELPIPSPLVAFSKDSKSVYFFDWINLAIGVMDVESK
jgi:hypothetical protein